MLLITEEFDVYFREVTQDGTKEIKSGEETPSRMNFLFERYIGRNFLIGHRPSPPERLAEVFYDCNLSFSGSAPGCLAKEGI